MSLIIFVQSRFPTGEVELLNLLNRWKEYEVAIQKISPISQINVFSFKSIPLESRELLYQLGFIDSKFPSKLTRFLIYLKNSKAKVTIVCGNNLYDFWVSIILKLLFKQKIRVQIQFHGDIYSFNRKQFFKSLIRVITCFLGSRTADSIRVVSEFQLDEIATRFGISQNKFVIAPLQINPLKIAPIEQLGAKSGLTILGRLHPERGVSEMIQLVSLYCSNGGLETVSIVGDGPKSNEVFRLLRKEISDGRVRVVKRCSPSEVRNLLAGTNILLSTAPTEGYGLSIREAVLNGVKVIARLNKGTLEAKNNFSDSIELYSTLDRAFELIMVSKPTLSTVQIKSFRAKQKQIDELALQRLVLSWFQV
jgi:glycosyltransferase involved in cell wall biosynthesis